MKLLQGTLVAGSVLALASMASAGTITPPANWGKPSIPAANASGKVSFKHGGAALSLPANKLEISTLKSAGGNQKMVDLVFIGPSGKDKFELHFFAEKQGKIDDSHITGVIAKTRSGGVSKGNAGSTKCGITLSALTDRSVAGTASCHPMAALSGELGAKPVTDIKFEAKLK